MGKYFVKCHHYIPIFSPTLVYSLSSLTCHFRGVSVILSQYCAYINPLSNDRYMIRFASFSASFFSCFQFSHLHVLFSFPLFPKPQDASYVSSSANTPSSSNLARFGRVTIKLCNLFTQILLSSSIILSQECVGGTYLTLMQVCQLLHIKYFRKKSVKTRRRRRVGNDHLWTMLHDGG